MTDQYHYPGPVHPYPWVESPLFVCGALLMIGGRAYAPAPWDHWLIYAGVALLCVTAVLLLIPRMIWDQEPISDEALAVLRWEASLFPAVMSSWEAVCAESRRPTWEELEIIVGVVKLKLESGFNV